VSAPAIAPPGRLPVGARIYVAGHRGLLGSAVARRLARDGHERLIVRASGELDLRDPAATLRFLEEERPEYVFMCAARVGGIKANMDAPADFLLENLQLQSSVLDGSRRVGVRRLLFVGSSCIYPREAPNPISERALLTGPLEPTNEGYALAKIAGIRLCQFLRAQHGCDFVSAIPTNLFGPGDHYDLERAHLLPALIRKVHEAKAQGRREVPLWGSGRPRREFMSSDDCADALVFIMERYAAAEPINVGTGVDATVLELAETVARVLDADVTFVLDPTKPDGMLRKLVDVSRLRDLGWTSRVSLEDGIRTAYADYLDHGGAAGARA
jgi:GDP-L-fucose synthase